jgi:hypothetical protein
MRSVLMVAATAVISLVLLLGLRWLGIISQDAVAVGFCTGLGIAIAMALTNRKSGNTG